MRLIGYVDGIEVCFDFYPPNIYKAIIPKRLNGRYIVQLTAVDEAGNETNVTDIYMYISFQEMEFKVLDEKFKFNIDENKLSFVEIVGIYDPKVIDDKFYFKEIKSKYSFKELVV